MRTIPIIPPATGKKPHEEIGKWIKGTKQQG